MVERPTFLNWSMILAVVVHFVVPLVIRLLPVNIDIDFHWTVDNIDRNWKLLTVMMVPVVMIPIAFDSVIDVAFAVAFDLPQPFVFDGFDGDDVDDGSVDF